jgi:hypothetical protein
VSFLAFATPAHAAGSWGGAGTPFTIGYYNTAFTGFLPSAPSSVPSTSTITNVTYSISYYAPQFPPGSFSAQLCSSSTHCTTVYTYSSSTSYFNGMPARTSLYFKASWVRVGGSGAIPGGVSVTDSIGVSYN